MLTSMAIALAPEVFVKGTGTKRVLISPTGGSECESGFKGCRSGDALGTAFATSISCRLDCDDEDICVIWRRCY